MKKRLRKKKRVGEFKELAFEVKAELHSLEGDGALDSFVRPARRARRLLREPGAVRRTSSCSRPLDPGGEPRRVR